MRLSTAASRYRIDGIYFIINLVGSNVGQLIRPFVRFVILDRRYSEAKFNAFDINRALQWISEGGKNSSGIFCNFRFVKI
jgi:hypothetical protein